MDKKVVTKRGKPYQSSLLPYKDEIISLKKSGYSLRAIATEMMSQHNLQISHNSVASFLRTSHITKRNFLNGISDSRKLELLKALKALWTHDSTAIEGNTLSLGDTMLILEYGLTVKGKPLKDQEDVAAHGRAVDFIRELSDKGSISKDDIFTLHRMTVSASTSDIYRPIGAWKREDNGTYGAEGKKSVYMPYASADDTPRLMKLWIKEFNSYFNANATKEIALESYIRAHVSFVRIHPFFDGNGRLARLLANLPVLFAGYPPIVVSSELRQDYISALWNYQRRVGVISAANLDFLPEPDLLNDFRELMRSSWQTTLDLVSEALNHNSH